MDRCCRVKATGEGETERDGRDRGEKDTETDRRDGGEKGSYGSKQKGSDPDFQFMMLLLSPRTTYKQRVGLSAALTQHGEVLGSSPAW